MKHQTLFSSKDKSENNIVSSAAILFGVLRVKRSFFSKGCCSRNQTGVQEICFSSKTGRETLTHSIQ